MIRRVFDYLHENAKALIAGFPQVSDEVYAERAAQCQGCPHRRPASAMLEKLGARDECSLCGCALQGTILGDKLRMATAQCPDKPPRWLATIEVGPDQGMPARGRRVLAWVDEQQQPVYLDAVGISAHDVVVLEVGTSEHPEHGTGYWHRWDKVAKLIPPDFTGELAVVVDYQSRAIGRLRFEKGRSVGLADDD